MTGLTPLWLILAFIMGFVTWNVRNEQRLLPMDLVIFASMTFIGLSDYSNGHPVDGVIFTAVASLAFGASVVKIERKASGN